MAEARKAPAGLLELPVEILGQRLISLRSSEATSSLFVARVKPIEKLGFSLMFLQLGVKISYGKLALRTAVHVLSDALNPLISRSCTVIINSLSF